MRRRLTWLLAALLAAIAVPSPARSASDREASPRVHLAGIDRAVDRGAPGREGIPWLVREGSRDRGAAPDAHPNATRSPLAPEVVPPTFDGVPDLLLTSPADPTGALGVDHHLAAVNVHMAFYDRNGELLSQPGVRRLRSLDPALAGLNAFDFDPKVVYDHYRQHFVLAFLSATATRSFLSVVAIPEGSENDTSQWCTLHMSGDQVGGNGKQFADYPSVGFTEGRFTISTNQYDFSNAPAIGGFRYAQVISIAKSKLYNCDVPTVPIRVFSRAQTRDPDGSRAFTIVPAVSIGGSPTAQYMTSMDFNGSRGKLILWRLTVANGTFKLVRTQVSSGSMSLPPWGRQCPLDGGGLNDNWDTGDVRLTSAFWDAARGRAYTATSIAGNIGGGVLESVVRWWEIDPASTIANSTTTRKGTVGAAGRDAAWPSVATDSAGKLWVNYARAGVGECLSAVASVVQPGATGHAPVTIRAGFGRYEFSSGPDRWGDYTAVTRDPLNGTQMAAYGAVPIDDGGPAQVTEVWQQVIATLGDV